MVALGIDFGTSTTVAAVYFDGTAKVVKCTAGQTVIPSCVAFLPNGEITVGMHAKTRRVIDPANALYSVKRILGLPWHQSEVKEFRAQYPFELEKGADDIPVFVTRAGKITPIEATTHLLRMVHDAPALAEGVGDVTLTVPATFSDAQRSALSQSASQAGFASIKIIDEPSAAVLAHLAGDDTDQVVVVYDLGGGTFDITVMRWSGAGSQVLGVGGDSYADYEILGTGGDSYLGGDDIDLYCARWARQQVLERYRWDVGSSATSFQKLLFSCETAKQLLSIKPSQLIDLTSIDEVLRDKTLEITREDIQRLCAGLVQRSFIICDETMAKAGLSPRDIDSVILAGGGCHMPMIKQGVQRYFGQPPLTIKDPDCAVAIGAALHAGRAAAGV